MIQDIFPHKLYNQYRPDIQPGKDDYVICIKDQNMLVNKKQMDHLVLEFPRVGDFTQKLNLRYLLSVDDEHYFIYDQQDKAEEPLLSGYDYMDIRKIRKSGSAPRYRIFALLTAKHLYDWYRDNVFCGRCGEKMVHSKKERAMMCKCCGYVSYPRIMPAVIVGVRDKDRLLITRYRNGYQHNALVAGFTEIGETLEETVMREVMEEHMHLIDNARETMEEMGITPIIQPIRGGTDGARLSFMGLPCPNLGTGSHNFHGRYEYACVQSMEKITEFLIALLQKYA